MLRLTRLWMTLVPLFIITMFPGLGLAGEEVSLTPPIHLAQASYYEDGGTVAFVLVGARGDTLRGGFDGRMQEGLSSYPQHCYVGNVYPTRRGARLLPLWGSEERALVGMLTAAVRDTLSSDEIDRLLSTRSALELPSDIGVELWHLVLAVERRRHKLEAIDRGLLASPAAVLQYFGVVRPLHADSLGIDAASRRFAMRIRDASGKTLRVSFPASPASVMSASSVSGPGYSGLRFEAGGVEDRLLMTLMAMALEGGPEGGRTPRSVASAPQYQRDRDSLLAVLRMRTARILEADAGR